MGFQTPKYELKNLLSWTTSGKVQLPDFQRGYKWEDERIRQLLVTILRGHPLGVVMMLGGNIPGETTVLSTEIYRLVEALEWGQAHRLSLLLLAFAFLALLALLAIERKIGVRERS